MQVLYFTVQTFKVPSYKCLYDDFKKPLQLAQTNAVLKERLCRLSDCRIPSEFSSSLLIALIILLKTFFRLSTKVSYKRDESR